jgi:hypothetical protein
MAFKFKELFRVEFRHRYFGGNGLYNEISVKPSAKTRQFILDNNLLFKAINGGFIIGYETGSGSVEEARADVLKTGAQLFFRLDLTDQHLYNYTGNLPGNISNLIFHFWNYNAVDETYRKSGMLQAGDFIGKDDMNDTRLFEQVKNNAVKKAIAEKTDPANITAMARLIKAELKTDEFKDKPYSSNIVLLEDYFSKPFGQLSIKLNPDPAGDFAEKFVLQFDALATYWQYILRSDHFANLKAPSVINNKSNEPEFEEPVPVTLPDERQAISITSKKVIPLTREPQRKFRLVTDFDASTSKFKELNPPMILPDPDINLISGIAKSLSDDKEKKYSIIIL